MRTNQRAMFRETFVFLLWFVQVPGASDSQKCDLSNITQFTKQSNYFFGRLVNNRNIVLRVFKRMACTQTLFY